MKCCYSNHIVRVPIILKVNWRNPDKFICKYCRTKLKDYECQICLHKISPLRRFLSGKKYDEKYCFNCIKFKNILENFNNKLKEKKYLMGNNLVKEEKELYNQLKCMNNLINRFTEFHHLNSWY